MGQISELFDWLENAHAKFEKHGAVILEQTTRQVRQRNSQEARPMPERTYVTRICNFMRTNPWASYETVKKHIRCSPSAYAFAVNMLKREGRSVPPKKRAERKIGGVRMVTRLRMGRPRKEGAK